MNMFKELNDLLVQYKKEIKNLQDTNEVSRCKNQYHMHAKVEELYNQMKTMIKEDKGKTITAIKSYQTEILKMTEDRITELQSDEDIVQTLLPVRRTLGSLHVFSLVVARIRSILNMMTFEGLKFQEKFGCSVESSFYNFTALNIPDLHPCRDDHQSFFLKDGMLRTQCTAVTARLIEENKTENGAFFTIGKTYRRDLDATHLPQFNQVDIVVIHEKANCKELFQFVQRFFNTFFQKDLKYRLRPSYFPFTNFSAEVDIWFCNKWMEIGGCGIVAPEVFDQCKSKYRMAFAMGLGVERLLMIKHDIQDIRDLYRRSTGMFNMEAA